MVNLSGNFNFDGVGNVKSSHIPRAKPAPKHTALIESRPPIATVQPSYMQPMVNGNYSVTASEYIAVKGADAIASTTKHAKMGIDSF